MNQPVPTLQTALDAVATLPDDTCTPTRKRDLKSAVVSFCKATGKRPDEVPAIPRKVRALMEEVPPLAHGYSERRWANIRSGVTQAMALVRDLMPSRNTAPLAPEWKALLDSLPEALIRRISPAARFFSSKEILPTTVSLENLHAYRQAIVADRMRRNAEQAADDFLWAWNRALAACPDWPQIAMIRESKREGYVYPLAFFPESFVTDVEAYLTRLTQGILLDDDDDDDFGGPVRPVRPATIKTRRFQLRTAASCLARSGIDPATFTSISVLVEIDSVRKILHFLMQRNVDGQTSGQVAQMASFLAKLAEHWVKVEPQHLAKLRRLVQRVAVPASGMTAKNRERLRPFDDDETVAAFLCLPDTIRRKVENDRRHPRLKARLAQMAAAIALQLVIPLRIANLAAIDLHRHLVANRNGVYLVIPEAETKNRQEINFQIPGFALEIVKWYIREYRGYLRGAGGPALFPGRNGDSKTPHTLALQIAATIHQFTGLRFNVHLFRHFAGKVFLDINPGNYEVVRQFLRHKRIDTTTSAYAGAETRKAGLLYADLVESLRAAHRPARVRRPK